MKKTMATFCALLFLGSGSFGTLAEVAALETAEQKPMTIVATPSADCSKEIKTDGNGDAREAAVVGDQQALSWEVELSEAGSWQVGVDVLFEDDNLAGVSLALTVDGEVQKPVHADLSLNKIWRNETENFAQDEAGNQIRPTQIYTNRWATETLKATENYRYAAIALTLPAGKSTLSLQSLKGVCYISRLFLYQEVQPPTYEEVLDDYRRSGLQEAPATCFEKFQGEHAVAKSSPSLYPMYDRTSPVTEPYNGSQTQMNYIGGKSWGDLGQWIEFDVQVPADGLYRLVFRARQNLMRGAVSSRKLYIDGQVPFQEAENLTFRYDQGWNIVTAGNGTEDYQFYFEQGRTYRLRLEVTSGEMGIIIQDMQDTLQVLNEAYRKINMAIGGEVDTYRDYQFDKRIPDVLALLEKEQAALKEQYDRVVCLTGQTSSDVVILDKLYRQLQQMTNDPRKIATLFSSFKSNIGTMGTYIASISSQPLDIDYIALAGLQSPLPKATATFWQNLAHEFRQFVATFVSDYQTVDVAGTYSDTITVWMYSGRDQLQVLRRIIDDSFSPENGIGVDLQLVSAGMLLPSIVAGKAPDVSLEVGRADPVNYALRGAVLPLSDFPDFDEVRSRFASSALTSYVYNGKIYALSETFVFPLLFYRQDILEELGLAVPQTWEEVRELIPELQKSYMDFGIPIVNTLTPGDPQMYYMLLFQKGGSIYIEDGKAINLHDDKALQAFTEWTDFHNNYQLLLDYNFLNRFRMGDMPVGIADYTMYNSLEVGAPEIRGLWDFTMVPGTMGQDGSINRTVPASGTGCILLAQSTHPSAAWEFLKWWTDTQAQTDYAQEIENALGPSGRYATANLEALESLSWKRSQLQVLTDQIDATQGIPEVAGGYYVNRQIYNAFRRVVIQKDAQIRNVLLDYEQIINNEIAQKRKEFRLE